MIDTLTGLKPGDVILAPQLDFKVYKVDSKSETRKHLMVKAKHRGDGDKQGNVFVEAAHYTTEYYGRVLGEFVCETAYLKTVPPAFEGHAKSDQTEHRRVARFVGGDKSMYAAYIKDGRAPIYNGVTHGHDLVDVTDGKLVPNLSAPAAMVDTKRFKKMDLICAVIAVHGPSFKDDILRRVAALEGKPWVIGSNTDYFTINKQDAIEMCGTGPRGKALYHNTVEGWRRGSQVLGEVDAKLIEGLK